jgi:hypothetical protein
MPNRWLHETHDLIVFGRSYWFLHKWKDAPSRTLGPRHRIKRHAWYGKCGRDWTLENPFPKDVLWANERLLHAKGADAAERFQANLAHDLLDRSWDRLSRDGRRACAGAFRAIVLDPPFLKIWAGIDVFESTLEVTYGNGTKTWEFNPDLRRDWLRLKSYIEPRAIDDLI